MTQYYVANVCRIDKDLVVAQVVPTDESYEKLDEHRLVIDLFLNSGGEWQATGYYDPATSDRGRMPSGFVPDKFIVTALEVARKAALDNNLGMAHHKFTLETPKGISKWIDLHSSPKVSFMSFASA